MQHDRLGRRVRSGIPLPLVNEVHLAERLAAAVEPDIQPVTPRSVEIVRLGDHQSVGLDRSIKPGDEAAHDQAFLACPGSPSGDQLVGPRHTSGQQFVSLLDIVGREELVESHRIFDRPVIDLDVRNQRANRRTLGRGRPGDPGAEVLELVWQLHEAAAGGPNPRSRHRPDRLRVIVTGPVCPDRKDRQQETKCGQQDLSAHGIVSRSEFSVDQTTRRPSAGQRLTTNPLLPVKTVWSRKSWLDYDPSPLPAR